VQGTATDRKRKLSVGTVTETVESYVKKVRGESIVGSAVRKAKDGAIDSVNQSADDTGADDEGSGSSEDEDEDYENRNKDYDDGRPALFYIWFESVFNYLYHGERGGYLAAKE
jgi:hypothetical protein